MSGSAGDPTADGLRLEMGEIALWAKDARGALFGHAFDDATEDEQNFVTRGAQAIESGYDARGDLALTSLAHEIRDVFLFAMVAVMDQRVNRLIGDAAIDTIQMRAHETLSGKFLLGAALTFDLGIGDDVVIAKKGPQVSWDEIGLQGRQLGIALNGNWCGIG